jgi:dihydrofolate reductase
LQEDLVVLGSGELVQTLLRHALVDELILLIHPRVLGSDAVSSPMAAPMPPCGSSMRRRLPRAR